MYMNQRLKFHYTATGTALINVQVNAPLIIIKKIITITKGGKKTSTKPLDV